MEAGRDKHRLASPARAALPETGAILYRNVNTEFILKKIIKIKKTQKAKKKREKPQKTTYMYIGHKVSGVAAFFSFFFFSFTLGLVFWFVFYRRDLRWYSILIKNKVL